MDIIKSIEHEQLKHKIPELRVGNTVRVHVRIKEGNKERIQVFEGIIIKKQGGGVNSTFTVRKTSYGVGVEKAAKTKELVGARIEDREIVVKEELVEEPVAKETTAVEETVTETAPVVEEVKEEAKTTEE